MEKELGEIVVTSKNALNYRYLENDKKLKDNSKKELNENND